MKFQPAFEARAVADFATFVLTPFKPKKQAEMLKAIRKAFEYWKMSLADDDGNITMNWGKGLLGIDAETEARAAATVTPVQAGGPDCVSEIDLAFKLWAVEYIAFYSLLIGLRAENVFAILLRECSESAERGSLIRAQSLVAQLALANAREEATMYDEELFAATARNAILEKKRAEHTARLRLGPKQGGRVVKERAEGNRAASIEFDTKLLNSAQSWHWTVHQRAMEISKRAALDFERKSGERPTVGTIEQYIKGNKRRVLRQRKVQG